jgi:hypothetical protein
VGHIQFLWEVVELLLVLLVQVNQEEILLHLGIHHMAAVQIQHFLHTFPDHIYQQFLDGAQDQNMEILMDRRLEDHQMLDWVLVEKEQIQIQLGDLVEMVDKFLHHFYQRAFLHR